MSTKPSVFVDGDQTTLIMAAYLNDLRTLCYELAGDGTNAPATAAAVRANLSAAESGVNADITALNSVISLASGVVLAGAPAAVDSSLKVPTTGWTRTELTREGAVIRNVAFSTVLSGSDLLVTLTDLTGSALSSTNPGLITFRSSDAVEGNSTRISVQAPLTVIIPAGATLGMVAGYNRFWVLAFTDGAEASLGVINCVSNDGAGAISVARLPATGSLQVPNIAGPTQISTAADSALVYYSQESLAAQRPYVVLGCVDVYVVTPGTWTTAAIEGVMSNPDFRPGDVIFAGHRQTGSVLTTNGTTEAIPDDTSIPQKTEGMAITGLSGFSNLDQMWMRPCILNMRASAHVAIATAADTITLSLCGATSDALAATQEYKATTGKVSRMEVNYTGISGGIGATLSVRVGPNTAANVVTVNGAAGATKLGGVMRAELEVELLSA